MSATACCTSKPIIYQIQLITTSSKFSPILPRNNSSSSSSSAPSSITSISEIHQPIKLNKTSKNDVNNNKNQHNQNITNTDRYQETIDITNDDEIMNNIDEEQFLAFVGLRHKTKKKCQPVLTTRSLAKRLAAPICLLPLLKNADRVRQALYILLPFLKFLSITYDIELFCSTDEKAKAESLLPRSVTQTRTSKTTNKTTNKRKVSKSEFITMAANTFRNSTRKTPMAKYINSTIQCNVVLDRLDQIAIDQIMQNANEDNQNKSKTRRSLCNKSEDISSSLSINPCSLNEITTKTTTTRTTITTMTTEKTTVKHKSRTTSLNDSKRFKKSPDEGSIILTDNDQSTLAYERICLKCFICSKREYIDAQETNSDILHTHWLEHGHDLSLNIYDSEIDSVLTRIVEFFHFPRRHSLEGKIQTIFILNSNEIRKTSPTPLDDDNCIILD